MWSQLGYFSWKYSHLFTIAFAENAITEHPCLTQRDFSWILWDPWILRLLGQCSCWHLHRHGEMSRLIISEVTLLLRAQSNSIYVQNLTKQRVNGSISCWLLSSASRLKPIKRVRQEAEALHFYSLLCTAPCSVPNLVPLPWAINQTS